MRKILVFVVLAVLAGSLGTGHAAGELATCTGSTALTGVPYAPSFGGSCSKTFRVSSRIPVVITLQPSATFTGTLRARVTAGLAGGTPVMGTFVSGVLVQGISSGVAELVPYSTGGQPIDWKLTITAGEPQTFCSPYVVPPVSCAPVAVPGFGFGAFSGSVAPAPPATPA